MKKETRISKKLAMIGLFGFLLIIAGCEGDTGNPGATGSTGAAGSAGPTGPAGTPGTAVVDATTAGATALAALTPTATVTGVTITSPPAVNFTVKDSQGRGIIGLDKMNDDRFVRFTLAKLVPGSAANGTPGSGEPNKWVPYILSTSASPTYDSPRGGGIFTDKGNGNYTYIFGTNVTAVTGVAYQPTLTHRLGGQIGNSSSGLAPMNIVYDFVPAGGVVTTTRNIAMTASCNECHDPLSIHGRRREVGYCVTCHNPSIGDEDMASMVHKIHTAQKVGTHDFTEVTYPQDVTNCRKCHSGDDAGTPDGNNWKTKPSRTACGACHTAADFDAGTGHTGGAQPDNSFCAICHSAAAIDGYHTTANPTPNNPNLPKGVPKITYVVKSATVGGANQATINFQILRDNVPLDLTNLPADLTATTSRPSFLLAYALPQDNIITPAEYNNLGRSSAQPRSVSLSSVTSLVKNSDGTFTATIAAAFPAGATLRAVGLQGYFQVDVGADRYPLHTPSALVAVTGDGVRREVVDSDKCAKCHEWFEGHGGNRVFDMQICVFCHVPNLSSSGREIATPNARLTDAPPSGAGLSADALTYPEATNNFKDMIHGIHGGEKRTTDYQFVRNRNNGYYYNWSEVTFPGRANNCLTCHKTGTYGVLLVDDTLLTTNRTTGVADGKDATVAAVSTAQDNVPNATDWVITPTAATCYACHDSTLARAHMQQNGAYINANRSVVTAAAPIETCGTCHAAGRDADPAVKHGL